MFWRMLDKTGLYRLKKWNLAVDYEFSFDQFLVCIFNMLEFEFDLWFSIGEDDEKEAELLQLRVYYQERRDIHIDYSYWVFINASTL